MSRKTRPQTWSCFTHHLHQSPIAPAAGRRLAHMPVCPSLGFLSLGGGGPSESCSPRFRGSGSSVKEPQALGGQLEKIGGSSAAGHRVGVGKSSGRGHQGGPQITL